MGFKKFILNVKEVYDMNNSNTASIALYEPEYSTP